MSGQSLSQLSDQLLNGAQPVQESGIESHGKRKSACDVDGHQGNHNMWHLGLSSSHEATKSATHSRLEPLPIETWLELAGNCRYQRPLNRGGVSSADAVERLAMARFGAI